MSDEVNWRDRAMQAEAVLRELVSRTNEMANRTSGVNPVLRQPWLHALQSAEAYLAEKYGR